MDAPSISNRSTTTDPHSFFIYTQGSWTTFLSKVMSGQLEELAGGPLFLLLAEYYKKHGPVYKLMFGPRYVVHALARQGSTGLVEWIGGRMDRSMG